MLSREGERQLIRDRVPVPDVRGEVLSTTMAHLPLMYMFTLDDFLRCYDATVESKALAEILATWSLRSGDLREHNPEHFFLGNPI
jgi:hypothetical protein